MNHHHCDCHSCSTRKRDHSFQKISPLRRKQRFEHHHMDNHVHLPHRQGVRTEFQDGRTRVNHEDGKKNIVIIM